MKNPLVCLLVGLLAGAALKSIRNIVVALIGMGGVAWTMWKKGAGKK